MLLWVLCCCHLRFLHVFCSRKCCSLLTFSLTWSIYTMGWMNRPRRPAGGWVELKDLNYVLFYCKALAQRTVMVHSSFPSTAMFHNSSSFKEFARTPTITATHGVLFWKSKGFSSSISLFPIKSSSGSGVNWCESAAATYSNATVQGWCALLEQSFLFTDAYVVLESDPSSCNPVLCVEVSNCFFILSFWAWMTIFHMKIHLDQGSEWFIIRISLKCILCKVLKVCK